jgi:3-hydroxybutyryl-CoA dehydrogenase
MVVRTVGMLGMGPMGSGIVQVAAQAGYDVIGVEVDRAAADRGLGWIDDSMARLVKRGTLTDEQREASRARITTAVDRDALATCDVVIEGVFEDADLKTRIWQDLDRIARPDALLASNTSTIPILAIAMATSRPERLVGLHFFNPVPMMELVELIRTPLTDPAVVDELRGFATSLGKTPVPVNDHPGFVGNLLIVPFLCDAIRALETGVAAMEDIDTVMKLGFNHPMGPFRLCDLIGIDIVHDMAASIYEETKDPRYQPPILLKQKLRMGHLGRKTGQGFYTY